jgi:hypothetical protein
MDATTAFGAPPRVDFAGPVLARLGRRLALVALVLLAMTGLVVCARRASGALVEPLSPGVLAGLGIVLAALAVWFRKTFAAASHSRAAVYAAWAAPSAVLVIWAAGVSLQGSPTLGLAALVGILLVEEGWSWGRLRFQANLAPGRGTVQLEPPALRPVVSPLAAGVHELPSIGDECDEAITQQLLRRQDAAGEVIEGWVRVDFAASQRHAAAHVAICPPLERVPECFAEQTDGPSARLKIAQVLPYGVRFELKLDEPAAQPASVHVEFSIHERQEAAN